MQIFHNKPSRSEACISVRIKKARLSRRRTDPSLTPTTNTVLSLLATTPPSFAAAPKPAMSISDPPRSPDSPFPPDLERTQPKHTRPMRPSQGIMTSCILLGNRQSLRSQAIPTLRRTPFATDPTCRPIQIRQRVRQGHRAASSAEVCR